MSDDDTTVSEQDEIPGPPGPRTAAAAARRARRIGGRPNARPPGPSHALDEDADAPADGEPDRPVARHASATPKVAGAKSPTKSMAKPMAKPPTKSTAGEAVGAKASRSRSTGAATTGARATRTEGRPESKADTDGPVVVTQVPGWLVWLPAAALAVVAVVFAIAIAVTGHGVWYAAPSATSVRDEVLAAAKTCVAATNSYKYTTIAADERNGLKCTTGNWTTNYRKAMEQVLTPSSKVLKSTQSTQINAAGVQSVTSHGTVWTVLVFGQASVTSINQKTPRPDPFSAVVTMQKSGGSWKIADIDQVLKPIKSS